MPKDDGPNNDSRMLGGRANIQHDPSVPKLPSIFINTAPKSGSVYVSETIQRSLAFSFKFISPGFVPRDMIVPAWIKEFYETGSMVCQQHLDASDHNIQWLKYYTDRLAVHLRDPRAILLSWTHHLNGQYKRKEFDFLLYVAPTPYHVEGYFTSWNLAQQLDWQIENFLPKIVAWMNGWVKFQQNEAQKINGFKILFTTFEEYKEETSKGNEEAFFRRYANFYGIPSEKFTFSPAAKTEETHFRNGEISEWKRVFTEQQMQRVNEIIPVELLSRFNWELPQVNLLSTSNKAKSFLPEFDRRNIVMFTAGAALCASALAACKLRQ